MNTKVLRYLIILACLGLLNACSKPALYKVTKDYTLQDVFADHQFGERVSIMPLDEAFTLTPEQIAHFKSKFHSKEYRKYSYSQRVFNYLQAHLENFNFHSETLTASESMNLNSGNCMSLALLTKSLSQLTHVGVSFELARTPPVYQRENEIELSSQHIRAVVYNTTTKNSRQFISSNDRLRIDYFSTAGTRALRIVKKEEFHSLFYSNLAAEAMLKDNFNEAYWNSKEALKLKPDNLIAINILGVLYTKVNQVDYAEKTFLYGLTFGGDQLEILNNYHDLLSRSKRMTEAQHVASLIENYDNPDPFKWLDLAENEFREGQYLRAIRYFEKAREKADYLHQPYAGIAKSNFQLGRVEAALKAMETALVNTHSSRATTLYQAKYEYMKSQQNIN